MLAQHRVVVVAVFHRSFHGDTIHGEADDGRITASVAFARANMRTALETSTFHTRFANCEFGVPLSIFCVQHNKVIRSTAPKACDRLTILPVVHINGSNRSTVCGHVDAAGRNDTAVVFVAVLHRRPIDVRYHIPRSTKRIAATSMAPCANDRF